MNLENDDSDNSLELSDFELSDEDVPDDDYFKQHVDVNVGDILDEVVGSSQLMRIEPNENVQTNMGEIREEDINLVCYVNLTIHLFLGCDCVDCGVRLSLYVGLFVCITIDGTLVSDVFPF